jgi:hypothetical protein
MLRIDLTKDIDLCKAARDAVAAGAQDQPWQAYRGDMLCLHGESIQWLADRSLRQEPRLSYGKYRPFEGLD